MFFFILCGLSCTCAHFRCTVEKEKIVGVLSHALGNVLMQNCESWHIALTLTTYLTVLANQVQLFMTMLFHIGSCHFQENNETCCAAKMLRNNLKNRTNLNFPRFHSDQAFIAFGGKSSPICAVYRICC